MILRADEKIARGGLAGLCLLNNPAGKLWHRGAGGKFKLQIEAVGFGEDFFHCPHAFDPAHGAGTPAEDETAFLLSSIDELWQSLGENPVLGKHQSDNQTQEPAQRVPSLA